MRHSSIPTVWSPLVEPLMGFNGVLSEAMQGPPGPLSLRMLAVRRAGGWLGGGTCGRFEGCPGDPDGALDAGPDATVVPVDDVVALRLAVGLSPAAARGPSRFGSRTTARVAASTAASAAASAASGHLRL